MSTIKTTSEGVVVVSYRDLVGAPKILQPSITKAFGSDPDCLGLIVVNDLPSEFLNLRLSLLKLAFAFAQLEEKTRDKYSDPSTFYSFGWSHGKEIMNGQPDLLKGSYYANIVGPDAAARQIEREEQERFPEYYGANIWPDGSEPEVAEMQKALEDLGQYVVTASENYSLVKIFLQPTPCLNLLQVAEQMLDSSLNLAQLIRQSHTNKARLLHYFPPPANQVEGSNVDGVNACGYHLDHSMLTGLCSALYLMKENSGEPSVVASPSTISGLYIKTRGGRVVKASYPADCLAFQTGEALQKATGGKLVATPHYVLVEATNSPKPVSRETFALFMQPNTDQLIGPKETFGQFSKRVFEEHYNDLQSTI